MAAASPQLSGLTDYSSNVPDRASAANVPSDLLDSDGHPDVPHPVLPTPNP